MEIRQRIVGCGIAAKPKARAFRRTNPVLAALDRVGGIVEGVLAAPRPL
jgi:hypothetical protein